MAVLPRPARPVADGLVSRALEVAGRLANDAAEVINATVGRDVRPDPAAQASPFDWVTDTDRTVERHTRRVLATEFPEIPVTDDGRCRPAGDDGYRWVVEPVDGGANYSAGLPWCAYSLALLDASGPVVGVVADPSRARIYAAARGRGMRANRVPVRVPDSAGTRGGLVCTELVGAGPWPGLDSFLRCATRAGAAVRVLGSPALAITQVALGHAVAAVLDSYHDRAVAGALCLAIEAGAIVVDRDGRPDPLPHGGLLVAAPGVLDDVLGWWREPARTG
jgi:myo-inositol-1(or 4)-monophosphatase